MKLLVLGGTKFLGRAIAAAALERGHELTLFNRGQTNPELFPEAEKLRGDRDGDLPALEGKQWDAVVDVNGYLPRVVRASAELLERAVGHYVFVSSVSVYADLSEPGVHEDSELATVDDPASEDVQERYGALKALCEQEVERVFGARCAIVRPGLIVGPHDPTGRFTYWPHRIERGGDVLAPGDPDRRVQFIDVRDLGEWIVHVAEERLRGPFNATGPEPRPTMEELLETCREAAASDARLVWVDDAFLLEHGVGEWMELPLWVASPEHEGLMAADVARAIEADLTFRPLEDTVRATLAEAEPADGAGLAAEREAELLAAWAART